MRSIFTAAIFSFLFLSCNKTNISEVEEVSKIKIENGVLIFDNFDSFSKTLKRINNLSDIDKDKWEKSLGFYSFRSRLNKAYNEIENEQNPENFWKILFKNSDIIYKENDEIKPLVDNFFQAIVNQNGIVRINNDYFRFYKGYETIVLNGSFEKVINASETKHTNIQEGIYSFKYNNDEKVQTMNGRIQQCTEGIITECRSSNGSNRRGYHKLELTKYIGPHYDPYTALVDYWIYEASLFYHSSGTKKTLFGWIEYNTVHTCTELKYVDAAGSNIDLQNISSVNEFKHWFFNIWFLRVTELTYDPSLSICSPSILLFKCTATTRGTSPNYCTITY